MFGLYVFVSLSLTVSTRIRIPSFFKTWSVLQKSTWGLLPNSSSFALFEHLILLEFKIPTVTSQNCYFNMSRFEELIPTSFDSVSHLSSLPVNCWLISNIVLDVRISVRHGDSRWSELRAGKTIKNHRKHCLSTGLSPFVVLSWTKWSVDSAICCTLPTLACAERLEWKSVTEKPIFSIFRCFVFVQIRTRVPKMPGTQIAFGLISEHSLEGNHQQACHSAITRMRNKCCLVKNESGGDSVLSFAKKFYHLKISSNLIFEVLSLFD